MSSSRSSIPCRPHRPCRPRCQRPQRPMNFLLLWFLISAQQRPYERCYSRSWHSSSSSSGRMMRG